MNEWILRILGETELPLQSRTPFAGLIFQKCSGPLSFFTIFYLKPSSRYSLVHVLSASSSKSALTVTALTHLQVKIKLLLQSRGLFVDHFARSSLETVETETLLRRRRTATLPEKT